MSPDKVDASHGPGVPPALKLHQVRCVVAAARRGSFRQAALALNLQQSTVSRCVRDLEDHLGVSIFERRVSGVRLTRAGDDFLRGAELALEHLGRAAGGAAALGRGDRQVLRIGAACVPGSGFLPELLQAAAAWRPRATWVVQETESAESLRSLRAGLIDVAIVLGRTGATGCEVTPLWSERLFLASADEPVPGGRKAACPIELRRGPLIFPPGEFGAAAARVIISRGDAAHGPARGSAGAETALRLVALGQGRAVVGEGAIHLAPPGVSCRPIAGASVEVSAVRLIRNEKPVLRRLLNLAAAMALAPAGRLI